MTLKINKSTTLTATLAASAHSATLTSAVFDNGIQVPLTLEPESSTKMEKILADITGTALTNITRAQDGSSDVEHTGTPTIGMTSDPSTWSRHLIELAGWIPAQETWAYASATTITVPSGATSKYSVGDKIKLTQTTVKYFYITAVADTTLTVTGGTDYTVANAAITSPYYSEATSPVGFPGWFNWTPTLSASGAMTYTSTTVYISKFRIEGRAATIQLGFTGTTGGTLSNAIYATLPVNLATTPSNDALLIPAHILNAGTRVNGIADFEVAGKIQFRQEALGNFSAGINSRGYFSGTYEI